ncbi:adenylate cyclase [Rhizobium sp. TRM95111]|uniref:adenylate/guanylate cyclase domain-containing protein n=1 Tax=Rhizobium alarense TaxID=2846851 RepID=UPI001F225B10|nr:adenylate/guanylate cyclase domain-containing protein [Rhizobium alarense]MCF3643072.1 adenylate cyclase [Rhizobium alarense]
MARHLAAILIADVVGYGRLSQIDEEGTRVRFQADLEDVFKPQIDAHAGRLVKTMGDALLVEFHSVVDAVRCASEVQRLKQQRKTDAAGDQALEFRIGINLGDILVEGDDIHGDGVNIAARLQTLAEPGGIAISGSAYDQVKTKLPLGYAFLGEQTVKSIDEPIRVYRVLLDPSAAGRTIVEKRRRRRGRWRGPAMAAAAMALATSVGAIFWSPSWPDLLPSFGPQRVTYPLSDTPSVAVLPFINVSGDAQQDHLADGLTDGLITELSKVSGLFVIARHSVFTLRGSAEKVQAIAAELGVHYILEGSLQRADTRLRINVKLIDAVTGLAMWAERYDRQYTDLFAVQDDVIGKIISALSVKLTEGDRNKLGRIPTGDLEAYDFYMRAEQGGHLYSDVDTFRQTLSFYQQAIDRDPRFADAHAGIARVAVDVWRNDYNFLWSAAVARKIAYDAAGEALKLDPDNARAHTVLALLQLVDNRPNEAIESANRAVANQPSNAEAHAHLALVRAHTGSREQAVGEIENALRLDPTPLPAMKLLAGVVFYLSQENRRAIDLMEEAKRLLPEAEAAREYLAAAYTLDGASAKGREEASRLLALFPDSNLNYYGYLYDYWRTEDLSRHLDALRKAGIPQWPFGFVGEPASRLSGGDLSKLVGDKTWTGKHRNGTDFVQFFDRAGNTAYRSSNTNITGVYEIAGDRLCETFEGYFLDRQVCGEVYRNGDEHMPEADYVHVTPQALKYFSIGP